MASRRQGTFSESCWLLQRTPEPFGTSEPFSPCSERWRGEAFFAAAQTLADGPSMWKTTFPPTPCMGAASRAVQKVQLQVQLLAENTLISPQFCLKGWRGPAAAAAEMGKALGISSTGTSGCRMP